MKEVAAVYEIAPLKQAIAEIHKLFAAAVTADNKALNHRIEAGKKLNKLRQRIEAGEAGAEWVANWWDWYESEFTRSRKDAERVMRMARSDDPDAAAEKEREDARERMRKARAGDGANVRSNAEPQTAPDEVGGSNADTPEASAEAMKAKFAALDDDQTKQPPRADVAKLVRAWVQASPEAKREFVRERWDEIALIRKRLDANGAAHEDRWIEGDTA